MTDAWDPSPAFMGGALIQSSIACLSRRRMATPVTAWRRLTLDRPAASA